MSSELPPIRDRKLFQQALTHRSYVNEHPQEGEDNERLEFLGDAVLGFIVGELLYQRYPQMDEAQLTRLRSKLVDEQQLSQFAIQLEIGKSLRLGRGADKEGGREKPSLLSDTFEAIIGAYFVDSGIDAVRNYLEPLLIPVAENIIVPEANLDDLNYLVDSKNLFQQWALAKFGLNPKYYIVHQTGPDHAREFTAEVQVGGRVYGLGKGRRKQEAEKRAAEAALKSVNS